MLITFSGLDGSGKSTLIEWLKGRLEGRGGRVAVYHMYYDVGLFGCARALADRLGHAARREPEARGPRAEGDARPTRRTTPADCSDMRATARLRRAVVWNRTVRLCVYPLDLLLFLACRLYVEKLRRRVLIMDRYFYDTLVDVDGGSHSYGARLLSLVTPTPHLPVYLDVSAEQALARKGEHTLEHLERRRRSYQKFFSGRRGAVVLASGGDLDSTQRELEQVVLERLGA